jgi:predicted transcriptional regulator
MEDPIVAIAAEIVAAYVSNNSVAASGLPQLIQDVYAALHRLAQPEVEALPEEKQLPAIAVRKSITPDFLVCLEDGLKFKSLKRHLRTYHNLTPAEYRAKWDLPADYPTVAPNYAETRSTLARASGLGQQGQKRKNELRAAGARKPDKT